MPFIYNPDADKWYEVPEEEDYIPDTPDPTSEDLDEVVDKMMTDPKYYDQIVGWF